MPSPRSFVGLCALALLVPVASAEDAKPKPNISRSKEFPNVYLSPSSDDHPREFRSLLVLEIVVQPQGEDARILYANGAVVAKDLLASVVDAPRANGALEIVSASALTLDGSGIAAEPVSFDAAHGLALFRVKDLDRPALKLSKAPLVGGRRLMWRAVMRDGRKTYLYSRPLRVHAPEHTEGGTTDLCRIIDDASSSLNADRSGSALVALDGSVVALMGRMPHWNVTPKNVRPRTKTAWAVPAAVVAKAVADVE